MAIIRWYDSGIADLMAGTIAPAGPYRLILLAATYTPAKTHAKRSDLGANEIAASGGYVAAGELVTVSVSLVSGETRVAFSAVSYPTATFSWRYGAVYRARGGAASADELLALYDPEVLVSSAGGAMTIDDIAPLLRIVNTW